MKSRDYDRDLLRFFIVRWLALVNIVIIYAVGLDAGSPIFFIAVNIYNMLLIILRHKIVVLLKHYRFLITIDITVAALLIMMTGGNWASPYYPYALACIATTALLVGLRYGMALSIYLIALSIVGCFLNENTMSLIAENSDYDILASSLLAFILVGVFFGYPVSLVRTIKATEASLAEASDNLNQTKELIAAVVDPNALSCRELEILESLSSGKTNAHIAAELHIAEKTVKNHLYKIYKKLGISSREEAIIYYHRKPSPRIDSNR